MNGLKTKDMIHLEKYRMIGSLHLLPFISFCYDSKICNKAVTIGWLWWAVAFVRKNDLHV